MNKYAILALGLLLSSSIYAWGRQDRHHIALSVGGGYTGYMHDYQLIDQMQSTIADLFVGYEFEHSHFILQTGLGLRYGTANISLDDYQTSWFAYDTQGRLFEYIYDFTDRMDVSKSVSLNVPLLFGAKFSCAYFLAGMINNLSVWENYSISVLATCTGNYDRYIGDFSGMDNHAFYKNEPVKRTANASALRPMYQIYPYLEVGVDVVDLAKQRRYTRRSNGLQVRIAAFTEFGALNLYSHASADEPYAIDKNHPFDLSLIEIPAACNNNYIAQSFMHDWSVGMRLTVLFDVSHGSHFCLTCDRNP